MTWFALEFLPVEILHLIFDYLWTNEILYSFLNITDYLDNVISSYDHSFINFYSILRPLFDLTCQYIRPDQILALVLSESNDTLDQTQLFFSHFPIEQFSRLRAITLIDVDNDSEQSSIDLNNLEHLKSLEIRTKRHAQYLHIMPKLTRFVISYQYMLYFESDTYITRAELFRLRHLTLKHCSHSQLKDVFRYAPFLVSLNVSIIFESHNGIGLLRSINNEKSSLGLTSLTLSIDISSK